MNFFENSINKIKAWSLYRKSRERALVAKEAIRKNIETENRNAAFTKRIIFEYQLMSQGVNPGDMVWLELDFSKLYEGMEPQRYLVEYPGFSDDNHLDLEGLKISVLAVSNIEPAASATIHQIGKYR